MKKIDIFLIHGTFAKNAEWIKEQSFLSKELNEKIEGDIQFFQHQWDGKNSFKSRFREGAKLAKKVEYDSRLGSIKILVGHSHGGNVSLYSLGAYKDIDLVVTLGTPFIINKTKQTLNAILNYTKFVLVFLVGIITALIVGHLYNGSSFFVLNLSIIIYLSIIGILIFIYEKGRGKIVEIVTQFKNEIQYIKELNTKIINVQYDFDEASFFLNIISNTFRPITNVIYYILNKFNNWILSFFYLLIVLFLTKAFGVLGDHVLIDFLIPFTVLLFLPLLFILVFFPISLILNGFSFNSAALGTYPFFLTLVLKTGVSKHLNGILSYAQDYRLKPPRKLGINHSLYYTDPNVSDVIAREINEIVNPTKSIEL
ncbi:MAG: hypothetical protein P1U56_03130 [Saprospiraceae bacterium]|nr:hypothetical protein [Saprospiraceae bacterium]